MSLHLVFSPSALAECRARILPGDALLLLGDGVYAATEALSQEIEFVVLEEDALARGVNVACAKVDYAGFVELVTRHKPVVSWHA